MTGNRLSIMCRLSAIVSVVFLVSCSSAPQPVAAPQVSQVTPAPQTVSATPKKKFNLENVAALLNKMPEEAAPQTVSSVTEDTSGPVEPITVSEMDGLRQSIQRCYDVGDLAGSLDAGDTYAALEVHLARDGSVTGVPKIIKLGSSSSRLLAERARKAVIECAPYKSLPTNKYRSWQVFEARFSLDGLM